jgi:hypothetical protein
MKRIRLWAIGMRTLALRRGHVVALAGLALVMPMGARATVPALPTVVAVGPC